MQLWAKRDSPNFTQVARFKNNGHTATVNDVSWAPLAGRSYHLIASCSKDKTVIVWKVIIRDVLGDGSFFEQPKIEMLQRMEHH